MKNSEKCDLLINCQMCECKLELPNNVSDIDDIISERYINLSNLDVYFIIIIIL